MRSQRQISFAMVFAIALLAECSRACIWDYDTLRDERRGLPGVAEVIAGRYERRSQFFYTDRIEHMSKLLKTDPNNTDAIDNLAVALFRTGQIDEAERLMLDKEKRFPDQYTTSSNLATFYMLTGRSSDAVPLLEKALRINPNAHFGREKYQLLLAKYIVLQTGTGHLQTFADFLGTEPMVRDDERHIQFNDHFIATILHGPTQLSADDEAAMNAIIGMIRYGTDESSDLFVALGDLLLKSGNRFLAIRAFDRATKLGYPGPEIKEVLIPAILLRIPDEVAEKNLDANIAAERAAASEWVRAYMDFADNLIRTGQDPDAESNYAPFYKAHGPTTEPLGFAVADFLPKQPYEVATKLLITVLALIPIAMIYQRHRKAKKANSLK